MSTILRSRRRGSGAAIRPCQAAASAHGRPLGAGSRASATDGLRQPDHEAGKQQGVQGRAQAAVARPAVDPAPPTGRARTAPGGRAHRRPHGAGAGPGRGTPRRPAPIRPLADNAPGRRGTARPRRRRTGGPRRTRAGPGTTRGGSVLAGQATGRSPAPPTYHRGVMDAAELDVTVVLPVYNEAGHVLVEIERIQAALDASPTATRSSSSTTARPTARSRSYRRWKASA